MRALLAGGLAAAIAAAGWAGAASPPTGAGKEKGMEATDQSRPLSGEERATLLRIARDAVECRVKNLKAPGIERYALTPALREHRGAFVTLTNRAPSNPVHPEPLRGCIGNFVSEKPLAETVREMAEEACSRDPRFPPVSERELRDIRIEISALSPLFPVADPLSIRKGVHGVYIRPKGGRGGGTYLPQVWAEHFPDKDAAYFWTHLCRFKAGLPDDAWRRPDRYEALVYTADVFGEETR